MDLRYEFENSKPRRVAILGAGTSGQAVKNLLDRMEWMNKTYDERDRTFAHADVRACSFVVASPGFPPDHAWIKLAENAGKKVLSEPDLGALFLRNHKIVAVTGTNGKTSVTTLLAHVATEAGHSVVAGGNLGVPLCQLLADGLSESTEVYLETSSFQAGTLRYLRPSGVIWTNFDTDHLDYHGNLKEYFRAKYRLVEICSSTEVFVGRSVVDAARRFNFKLPEEVSVIDSFDRKMVPFDNRHFLVQFPQLENLALVHEWFRKRGMDMKSFFRYAKNYRPEDHRLKKMQTTVQGVAFWNDSKSTNLSSVVAACKNFARKIFWIGGGKGKGEDPSTFVTGLIPYVEKAFLFGESGRSLHEAFEQRGTWSMLCHNLKDAVEQCHARASRATEVLFSPGFSSFDGYSGYAERGNSFEKIVLDLKNALEGDTQVSFNKFAQQTGR